jgi:hypothetical protein
VRAFVYGALMVHPHVLAQGVRASVPEHAVRFTARGMRFLEPSFAALEEAPGETAWGVLVELADDAWRRIRRRELAYLERTVMAQTAGEEPVESIALFNRRGFRCAERPPSARYAGLLLRGAERHALPSEVVERYRKLAETGTRWSLLVPRAFLRR